MVAVGASEAYLCQEIVTASGKRFMPVTLEGASCQGDNDNGALEKSSIHKRVFCFNFLCLSAFSPFPDNSIAKGGRGRRCAAAEDADVVQSLQSPDRLGSVESVHYR